MAPIETHPFRHIHRHTNRNQRRIKHERHYPISCHCFHRALTLSGAAYAEDALPQTPTASARTIYEGVDAAGQIVRVTISKSADAQSVAVSSHAQQYPELNWTARIGSGTAATIAH